MAKVDLIVSGLLAALACGGVCAEEPAVRLNIAAQPLDRALNSWADQTGYQIIIPDRGSSGRTAPTVTGTYTPEAALKLLLASTDLKYQFVGDRTVAIRVADSRARDM